MSDLLPLKSDSIGENDIKGYYNSDLFGQKLKFKHPLSDSNGATEENDSNGASKGDKALGTVFEICDSNGGTCNTLDSKGATENEKVWGKSDSNGGQKVELEAELDPKFHKFQKVENRGGHMIKTGILSSNKTVLAQ